MPPSAQARSIAPVVVGTTVAPEPEAAPQSPSRSTRKPPSRSKSGSSAGLGKRSKSPSARRRSSSMSRKGARRSSSGSAMTKPPEKSCLKKSTDEPKPKKNIVFAQRVRVQCIPHVDDMDQDVIDSIWYVKAEFDVMKKDMTETIRYMMAMDTIYDDPLGKYCTRGLEFRTKAGAKARQQRKAVGWLAVMDEQDRLFELSGTPNPSDSWEAVRVAYQTSADHTRHAAMLQGLKDRESIEAYIAEDTGVVAATTEVPASTKRSLPRRSKSSVSALPSTNLNSATQSAAAPSFRPPSRSRSSLSNLPSPSFLSPSRSKSTSNKKSSSKKPKGVSSPTKSPRASAMMRKIIAKSPLPLPRPPTTA